MPNIEIISLRFNLDKEDDRKLFKALQERSGSGKRNEFIKQILFTYVMGVSADGRPAIPYSSNEVTGSAVSEDRRNPREPDDESAELVSKFVQ